MLYLLRHGQTEWNKQRKLQGRSDIPLSDAGRQMALDAAEKYRDTKIDLCFCSPLCRAAETAEIFLAGRDIPIIMDNRLVEMCFGVGEGTTGFQEEGHPLATLFNRPGEYVPVGGSESFEELFSRTGAFLSDCVDPALREGKDVLIVGHGAMILSIVNRIRHVPQAHFWDTLLKNCSLESITNIDVFAR